MNKKRTHNNNDNNDDGDNVTDSDSAYSSDGGDNEKSDEEKTSRIPPTKKIKSKNTTATTTTTTSTPIIPKVKKENGVDDPAQIDIDDGNNVGEDENNETDEDENNDNISGGETTPEKDDDGGEDSGGETTAEKEEDGDGGETTAAAKKSQRRKKPKAGPGRKPKRKPTRVKQTENGYLDKYLPLWTMFKTIRSDYISDSDALRKIMEDGRFSDEKLTSLSTTISKFKRQYGIDQNWVNAPTGNKHKTPGVIPVTKKRFIDETDEEEEEDDDDQPKIKVKVEGENEDQPKIKVEENEDQANMRKKLRELKERLRIGEVENRNLRTQIATLKTEVTNLNDTLAEEKIKYDTISSHLNCNTEIVSSGPAVKINSANDIYMLFPSFNGSNTTLKVLEIVDNRYHIEIKHENNAFTNISNHFIKDMPGYHYPVTCTIKHNDIDTNGLYFKKHKKMPSLVNN